MATYEAKIAKLTIGGVEVSVSDVKVSGRRPEPSSAELYFNGKRVSPVTYHFDFGPSPDQVEQLYAMTRRKFRRAAYHEAGHAVAGTLVGFQVTSVYIFGEGYAITKFRFPEKYELHEQYFMGAAGAASEVLFGISNFITAGAYLLGPNPDADLLKGLSVDEVGSALCRSMRRLDAFRPAIEAVAEALLNRDINGEEIRAIMKRTEGR